MKVNHPTSGSVQSGEAAAAKHSGRAGSAKEARRGESSNARHSGDVKAEISEKARDAALAKNIASKTPDVREARVSELKQKIASGTYQVDPQGVADRLVEDHLKMADLG